MTINAAGGYCNGMSRGFAVSQVFLMFWVTVYNNEIAQECAIYDYLCICASLKVCTVGSTDTGGSGKLVKAMQLEALLWLFILALNTSEIKRTFVSTIEAGW